MQKKVTIRQASKIEKWQSFVSFVFARVHPCQVFFPLALILLITSAVLNIRKSNITPHSYIFSQYSDFLTFSLYLADLLLVLVGVVLLYNWGKGFLSPREESSINWRKFVTYETLWRWLFLSPFVLWQVVYLLQGTKTGIQPYFWQNLSIVLLLILLTSKSFWIKVYRVRKVLIGSVIALAVLESILALVQFSLQGSVGLPFSVEPVFFAYMPNVATLSVDGLLFVRPYGTFPHPNVLAGFLACSLLFSLWGLGEISIKKLSRWLILSGLPIIAFGLALTQSRTAISALVLALLVGIIAEIWKKKWRALPSTEMAMSIVVIVSLVLALIGVLPVTKSRIPDKSEPAITERANYNRIAMSIIGDNFTTGLGPYQSLLHMQRYSARSLEVWEHQPIHNVPLLIWAEVGIYSLIGLFLLMFGLFWHYLKKYLCFASVSIMPVVILIFTALVMIYDHYFYTLRIGQLIFWAMLMYLYYQKEPQLLQK